MSVGYTKEPRVLFKNLQIMAKHLLVPHINVNRQQGRQQSYKKALKIISGASKGSFKSIYTLIQNGTNDPDVYNRIRNKSQGHYCNWNSCEKSN